VVNTLKVFYRASVPKPIRVCLRFVRNLFGHVWSDREPATWDFDYETYWTERIEKGDDAVSYAELVQICATIVPENARLLDIGCGTGIFLQELTQVRPIKAVGIDVSHMAVETAQRRGITALVFDAEADCLSGLGTFDVVTIFEVLEHVAHSERLLLNVRQAFPNAKVIASVPNTGYIASRLRLLLGRFPRQWIVHPAEHLRFWTLYDFRFMAASLGYRIAAMRPLRGPTLLARRFPGVFAEALVFELHAGPEKQTSLKGRALGVR
jgi:methionine biosynthesis protein MetW